jgi:hypothetical protein
MVVCGWALQALDAHPGLWDKSVDQLCGKDPRVQLAHPQPTEGWELPRSSTFELGGATLRLAGRPRSLVISGTFAGDELKIEVFAGPDGKGTKAVIRLKTGQHATAVNGEGEPLNRIVGEAEKKKDGSTGFYVDLSYTVGMKDQGRWANGIELGRYSIVVNGKVQNFVLASDEKRVRRQLEGELAGGLRTWEAIFEAKGFIPTGLNAGGDWDKFSDSGGYAHLIAAASQYILWKQGKRDWEIHRVPTVK